MQGDKYLVSSFVTEAYSFIATFINIVTKNQVNVEFTSECK